MMKWTHTEKFDKKDVGHLVKALGMGATILDLANVDFSCGRGVGQGWDRRMWTKGGKRIEVCVSSDGVFGASQSKEVDTNKPKKVGDKNVAI